MLQFLDRYFPSAYRAILADEFTWRDNPVLRREQLREGRRRDRAILLLAMFTTLLGVFGAAVWTLPLIRDLGRFRAHVPPFLGGSYPVAFFLIFSGVHVWFVWHAAYRRSYYLLLQEYRQNSLSTLLCTRIPPFQLLLMASLHPFRQGMFVALAGLPFYAWLMSLGGVRVWELAGLYLLFATISFRPPRWSLPVFAGIPAEEIQKRQRSGRPKTWGEWWLYNGFWIAIVGSWYLNWAFGPRWVMKLLWPLGELIPNDAYQILPAFFFSWPLALVRFLWTPAAFFSLSLPPILPIFPFYLFARLMAIWESSVQLRTGDADTTQPLWDLREYWRMRRIYGIALAFVLLGFLWRPYVASGISSVLLQVQGGTRDWSVAGLFYLAGSLAAMVCWARAREMSAIRAANGGRLLGERNGEIEELPYFWEAWYVFSPLLTVCLLYIAACLLAGSAPIPAPAARIAGPLLAISAIGALYARGIRPGLRNYLLSLLVPLAAWFIPIGGAGGYVASISPLAALFSLSEQTNRILTDTQLPHATVAPWFVSCAVCLAAGALANARMKRRSAAGGLAAYNPGSAFSPLPAVMPSSVAAEVASVRKVTVEPLPVAAPTADAPPVIANSAAAPSFEATVTPIRAARILQKKDTPTALRLIAWLQARWDNAVLVKELRVLLRGHLGRDEQIAIGVLLVSILVAAAYRADLSSQILEGPARLLFGSEIAGGNALFSGRASAAIVFGGMAALLTLLVTLIASAAGATVCGTAFAREKDKSTLGFVLITPMRTAEILAGKFLGMLTPMLIGIGIIGVWSAILCVPVAEEIGVWGAARGLLYGLSICLLFALLSGSLGIAGSTIFRREADAAALGILVVFGSIFGVSYMTAVWPHLLTLGDVRPTDFRWVWLAYLALLTAVIAPAMLGFTYWRLSRARSGDIAFESAAR
jgi:ABC-type transport system involved in multi-copper enzyme maturation permease subunit